MLKVGCEEKKKEKGAKNTRWAILCVTGWGERARVGFEKAAFRGIRQERWGDGEEEKVLVYV